MAIDRSIVAMHRAVSVESYVPGTVHLRLAQRIIVPGGHYWLKLLRHISKLSKASIAAVALRELLSRSRGCIILVHGAWISTMAVGIVVERANGGTVIQSCLGRRSFV
jgi:hypothetical protein